MGEFSEFWNINNVLNTLRQQRNDGCGQTLVLNPKVFILDGNTITDRSFNNKGNGNQDFSSADINSIVPAIRSKRSSPSPAPAIDTVSTNHNQYHASPNNAGMQNTLRCAICKRNLPCPPEEYKVHCQFCDVISYRY